MLLAVDVGNTKTVVGLFAGEELLDSWYFDTVRGLGTSEARVRLGEFAARAREAKTWPSGERVTAGSISSVVAGLAQTWQEAIREEYGAESVLCYGSAARELGLFDAIIDDIDEAGPDLVADGIAARIVIGVLLITLGVLALVPLVMRKHQWVIWDQLSLAAVAILTVLAYVTGNGNLATNLGYLVFGLMWLLSCPAKEPLCATYVKHNYGGEKAYKNPLFMKTNYILAAAWGVLYVLTAVWTCFLRQAGFGNVLIVVNNVMPMIMGAFTVWFERWYPAWLAGGGGK